MLGNYNNCNKIKNLISNKINKNRDIIKII